MFKACGRTVICLWLVFSRTFLPLHKCCCHLLPQKFEEMKAEVVRAERLMLRSFGFIVHVEQPHRFVLSYAHVSCSGLGQQVTSAL